MLIKSIFLSLGLLWSLGGFCQTFKVEPSPKNMGGSIRKSSEGQYILEEKNIRIAYSNWSDPFSQNQPTQENYRPRLKYHITHPYLPLGTILNLTYLPTNGNQMVSLQAEVTMHQDFDGRYDYLRMNKAFAKKLSTNQNEELYSFYGNFNLQYTIPQDSLLQGIEKQNAAKQFSAYRYLSTMYKAYDSTQTLTYAQKALEQARLSKDDHLIAQALLNLGDIKNFWVNQLSYSSFYGNNYGGYTNVETILEKANRNTKYPKKDIQRWNRFGGYVPLFYLWNRRSFDLYPSPEQLSDQEYLEYLKIRQAQNEPDKIAWGLKELGDLYRLKISYAQAEKYYVDLLKLREKQGNQEKLNWIWGYLAHFYLEQNKLEEAETYLQKLYEYRESEPDLLKRIWALGGLRNLSYVKKEVNKALDYQEQIFKLHEERGKAQYDILAVVLKDYRIAFQDRKPQMLDRLIKWYEEAENPSEEERQSLVENIASLAEDLEKYDIAGKYLSQTLDLYESSSSEKIRAVNDVAFYYQKANDFSTSYNYYKQGLGLAKALKDTVSFTIQLNKIGYFYEAQNNLKKADKYYKKAYKDFEKMTFRWLSKRETINEYIILGNQIVRIADDYFYRKRNNEEWALKYAEAGRLLLDRYDYGNRLIDLIDQIKREN